MGLTPSDSPDRWRAADLEAIRIALSIPAQIAAIGAIDAAMARLEQFYPDALPTARRLLAAIAAIDSELAGLRPEQLRAPIEIRRKAVAASSPVVPGPRPAESAGPGIGLA